MILLTVLLIIGLILLISGIMVVSIGGAGFILLFSDIIVCVLVIAWAIRKLHEGKKK